MPDTYKLSENAGDDIITELVGDELFFITKDPGGTPQTKLVTWDTLKGLVIAALDPAGASVGVQFTADTSSTSDADPGAGNIRWNHATQASATVIYLDDASADGAALTAIWPRLNAGGVMFLQHATDQDIWQIWEFTAINDASGYAKLTVTLWGASGSFADNDPMLVTLEKGQAPGVGGGGAWFVRFTPRDNEPPTTNYATLDTRNSRPVLDFDTATQETAVFTGVLPNDYAGSGVVIDIFCCLTSATSGTVGWDVAFERTQASTDDIDTDSFATAQTVAAVTVPGTSGQVLKMSVSVSDGANMSSLAAGELFRLRVRRDVASDTATGDAELLAVTIRGQ